jgi:hypothetical protein
MDSPKNQFMSKMHTKEARLESLLLLCNPYNERRQLPTEVPTPSEGKLADANEASARTHSVALAGRRVENPRKISNWPGRTRRNQEQLRHPKKRKAFRGLSLYSLVARDSQDNKVYNIVVL